MLVQRCGSWRVCLTLQSPSGGGCRSQCKYSMWCVAHLLDLPASSGGGCGLQAEYKNLWCACLSLESCQVGCAGCSVRYSTVCQVRYCFSGASYMLPSAQSHEAGPAGCKLSSAVASAYFLFVGSAGKSTTSLVWFACFSLRRPSSWVCRLHAACKYMRADSTKSPTTIAVAPKPSSQITDPFHSCSPISPLT